MTVQTLRLAGKEYTLIPSREFRQIAEEMAHYRAEMTSDLAVAKRRPKDRKDKPIPWEQAKKTLGGVRQSAHPWNPRNPRLAGWRCYLWDVLAFCISLGGWFAGWVLLIDTRLIQFHV